jgi:hypothetical protein
MRTPGALAALTASGAACAHGLGQRFDLPLPLELWVAGAGASIVLSFVLAGLFVRAVPPAGGLLVRAAPGAAIGRGGARRAAQGVGGAALLKAARALFAIVFAVTLVAGLWGSPDPFRNLAPTLVWVVAWTGLAAVSLAAGDVWSLVNPLRTLHAGAQRFLQRVSGERPAYRPYPRRLGTWPAVAAFIVFAWAQLVWTGRDVPANVALLLLLYACWTWLGMSLYGPRAWLRRGEALGVALGILARLSPVGLRVAASPRGAGGTDAGDAVEWRLRPPAMALLERPMHDLSGIVFVMAMLATVTFDGLLETAAWQRLVDALLASDTLGAAWALASRAGLSQTRVIDTLGLLGAVGAFTLAYLGTAAAMAAMAAAGGGRQPGVRRTAGAFVLTLVPIAVAYDLAHNLSMFLTAGQFLVPLASDPLGRGWDLFGTADHRVNLLVVDAEATWYFSVSVIVLGHAASVWLAHVAALRLFGTRRAAVRSQLPMVALMIVYTMGSLSILAQPIAG